MSKDWSITVDYRPPKIIIHDIVEIDDSGFYFYGKKIEDAGEAHKAFLKALNGGEAFAKRVAEARSEERERLLRVASETLSSGEFDQLLDAIQEASDEE